MTEIIKEIPADLYAYMVFLRATEHEAVITFVSLRISPTEYLTRLRKWRNQPQTKNYEWRRSDGKSALYRSIQTNTVGPAFDDPFQVAMLAGADKMSRLLPEMRT